MAFNADSEFSNLSPARGGGYGHPSGGGAAPTDLRGYLALLWRRKWIILPFLILTPLVAHVHKSEGTPVYDASAEVLLNRTSQNLSGLSDPALWDPARTIRTQANVARLPAIAQRVVEAAGLKWDPGRFLGQSSVDADDTVDLLTFRVRDVNPARATRLANLYAEKYIEYRQLLDTNALREASRSLGGQIVALKKQGLDATNSYANLIEKQQQLQTAQTLLKSNALLVREASGAGLVGSQSRRTELLALAAGIIVALALAFLVDTFDTRIRVREELAAELGLPLLGSLPEPRRRLRRRRSLVMLDEPNSAGAELFRILRTTLDVTALNEECRSIMVTSALEAEGKSTTAANLAIALARMGRHVVLIDMDLRRPSLHRFFDLNGRPGITDVVFERASVEDAAVELAFRNGSLNLRLEDMRSNGRRRAGTLEIIGSGTPASNPGDFMVTSELDVVLERLRHRADLIVVDGPPLLLSADALTLSSKIDALLVVARMKGFRREYIGDMKRVLAASPALKLGLVVTGDAAPGRRAYYLTAPPHEGDRQLVT
jgi:Mrp family chromosome partitioning ATPase